PSNIHDEVSRTLSFQLAYGFVQGSGEALAYRPGKSGHSDITHIWGQNPMRDAARLDHRRPVLGRPVWHFDGDATRGAIEASDLHLMISADPKVWRLWRHDRLGIEVKQQFAGADSRLKCHAVLDYVDEHPTRSVNRVDRTQGGVDGVRCGNGRAPLVKKRSMTAA